MLRPKMQFCLGSAFLGRIAHFMVFNGHRQKGQKMVSAFLLLCLSWLKLLFQRQQINVRGKPSSSVCRPTTQRSSEHKPPLQRYFGMCRLYMENGEVRGS